MMDSSRTRRVQRIALTQPVAARLGATQVLVIDIGVLGARVEHHAPLQSGVHTKLYFRGLVIDCRVVRSRLEQFHSDETTYQSGLEFGPMAAETKAELKEFLTVYVSHALQEQRLMIRRPRPAPKAAYAAYHLEAEGWLVEETTDPEQPEDGFTISTREEPAQVELLCEAWAQSDEDGRRLIQICARLALEGEGA